MSDSQADHPKYRTIIITGIVSLVGGVGSGLLLNFFTQERMSLVYNVTTNEVFPGQTQNIGIIAVQVSNDGKHEIENTQCRLVLSDAILTEPRLNGLPPTAFKLSNTNDEVTVTVPFFNPGESFSLQLLVQPKKQTIKTPAIEVRGKGIAGSPRSESGDRQEAISVATFFTPAATVLAAFLTLSIITRRRSSIEMALGGHDRGQRDEFAYLLGLNGFDALAGELRQSPRNHAYWALSDQFTEQILRNAEDEQFLRAIRTLEQLLEYGGDEMTKASRSIIYLNIARLAVGRKDVAKAKSIVSRLETQKDNILTRRVEFDPQLSPLISDESESTDG